MPSSPDKERVAPPLPPARTPAEVREELSSSPPPPSPEESLQQRAERLGYWGTPRSDAA